VILTSPVEQYIETTRRPADPVLAEMEEHARRDRIPVVHPPTGELLQVLALARGARRALEVGTAIGVSTLYIARGLAPDSTIVSFEIDPDRHAAAGEYLRRAGVGDRADLRLQDAREGLAALEGEFDFAFVDGIKLQYGDYLDQVIPLLAPGAVLAVDNVLQNGRVADPDPDERAEAMREFNQRLLRSDAFTATVTPVGDGVLVAVRR
jgi:caffeoyl-CoA O-methyltransferase